MQRVCNRSSREWFLILLFLLLGFIVTIHLYKPVWNPTTYQQSIVWQTFAFKTGDVILFRKTATAPWHSTTWVKVFNRCDVTHVGMVFIDPNTKQTYVWEMTLNGTRLTPLIKVMQRKGVDILVRPLLNIHGYQISDSLVMELISNMWFTSYRYDLFIDWFHRIFPLAPKIPVGTNKNKKSSCVDVLLKTFYLSGVLQQNRKRILPKDFVSSCDIKLPWINGFYLGEMTKLL